MTKFRSDYFLDIKENFHLAVFKLFSRNFVKKSRRQRISSQNSNRNFVKKGAGFAYKGLMSLRFLHNVDPIHNFRLLKTLSIICPKYSKLRIALICPLDSQMFQCLANPPISRILGKNIYLPTLAPLIATGGHIRKLFLEALRVPGFDWCEPYSLKAV